MTIQIDDSFNNKKIQIGDNFNKKIQIGNIILERYRFLLNDI